MKRFWSGFWLDTQGQDLVEYALAAGLVAVAAVAAMPSLSATVNNVSFTITGYDAMHDHVSATIPQSAAAGGKLYGRLHAEKP